MEAAGGKNKKQASLFAMHAATMGPPTEAARNPH